MDVTKKIVVPTRVIQGGFDEKFESDSYNVKLHGILSAKAYTQVIEKVNDKLKKSRPGKVDGFLLSTGVLMVPLAVWGIRHGNQKKRRKKLLMEAIDEFHLDHPDLYMRWNRRPISKLTIQVRLRDAEETEHKVGETVQSQALIPLPVDVPQPSSNVSFRSMV